MVSTSSIQPQVVQEDMNRQSGLIKIEEETSPKTKLNKATSHFILFLKTSSIHGLNHLVAVGRHPCEIFLWLSMVVISVFGTIILSGTTWSRYQSSPTVVSMDRDMFAWNTTFPCVTICPEQKLDSEKFINYIRNSNASDPEQLREFVKALANANFENFNTIPDYNDIPPEQYLDVILSLAPEFKPSLTIGASGINLEIVPTITEMGLCYAINSKVAAYNSPEYRAANRWDIIESNSSTFFVHPLDGEVFAQLITITTPYNVYVHGPLEVPDISTKYHHSEENYYMKIYVTAMTVYTSPEAAKLSVGQRRCRFLHENSLKHNTVYTYNMCRMECRLRLCLKYCNCVPFFYRSGEEKICDVKGMQCLAQYKDDLSKLRKKDGKKIHCECLPICDDVNYIIQSYALQEWFLGTYFQWGIVTYPRMRYRREIIFGFTDVLVSVGGMAGLFLGCSVLSFMEIIFFLALFYKSMKRIQTSPNFTTDNGRQIPTFLSREVNV